mgnify:CR=1 FL=1
MEIDDLNIQAPWLVETCPNCLGEGHLPTADFETMENIEVPCEECRGSGERYINAYDDLDKRDIKEGLYED